MSEPFRCVVADPPWLERGGGKIKRGADRHYPLLKADDIIGLMAHVLIDVHPIDPEGCHLHLWVTNNFLKDGLRVMEALDFRYITMRTWAKTRMGLGQYWRGQTEHILFGVMGKLPALARTRTTLIGAEKLPREGHSVKPWQAFQDAEIVSPAPRLELFARQERPGWTTWGNEIGDDGSARLQIAP